MTPVFFKYKSHKAYDISFPGEPHYTSRAILLVEGKINKEPLYVLVNHWPSRRGGAEKSEPRRVAAARKANEILKEVYQDNPKANILIMGDFNDDPHNRSIKEVLMAENKMNQNTVYHNPLKALHVPDSIGTLTYQEKWNLLIKY